MVYLLHFEKPYKHARHYLGFAKNKQSFAKRMQKHRNGTGSKLLRAIIPIRFFVSRIWIDGDRQLERKLKNHKKSFCPICQINNGE